ncbi:MAG: hypothetical protein EBS95_07075 [Chitinophagia bacterium]|jgi:hypothetical protein|nr:hypothetical protein [Chitinophagia bacterium]
MKSMNKIIFIIGATLSIFFFKAKAQDKTVVTLPEIRITSMSTVNMDVANAFRRTFPGAQQLQWYKYDKDYIAKFILKDMDHNALFRKNGVMIYDISYGYEKNMPSNVRDLVLKSYDNYKIIRSINIKAHGRDIWMVKMEGMKKYLMVRVEDMEMEEVEEFNKADVGA